MKFGSPKNYIIGVADKIFEKIKFIMQKLWLIIQREYTSRIRTRSFIIGTFLAPLLFAGFIFFQVKVMDLKDDNLKRIVVIDQGGFLNPDSMPKFSNILFTVINESEAAAKQQVNNKQYDALLIVPSLRDINDKKFAVSYFSDDKLGMELRENIKETIAKPLRALKVTKLGLDEKKVATLDSRIKVDVFSLSNSASKGDDKKNSSISGDVAMGIGYVMGFAMYISVLLFSMMVFRSVMEEKTSRISEVMISSVKPMQLMFGKIIGVGAVGLTQFLIQIILVIALITGITSVMPGMKTQPTNKIGAPRMGASQMPTVDVDAMQSTDMSAQIMSELQHQNWIAILPLFLLFFLAGFLMYSSLYAAVGSAVGEDAGEAQGLTFPITIPIILSIVIMTTAVRAPNSSLAVWSSMFPLFSPIVMPARLAFNPPVWQVVLSLTLLIGTMVCLVWLSGRIYRIGILLYGKKVTLREMAKWMFVKNI